jgi:hypothetical protein
MMVRIGWQPKKTNMQKKRQASLGGDRDRDKPHLGGSLALASAPSAWAFRGGSGFFFLKPSLSTPSSSFFIPSLPLPLRTPPLSRRCGKSYRGISFESIKELRLRMVVYYAGSTFLFYSPTHRALIV